MNTYQSPNEYTSDVPSRYHEGQELVCVYSVKYSTGQYIKRGQRYTVEHACQYGTAVVVIGQPKACFWDSWFIPYEEMPEELYAELFKTESV